MADRVVASHHRTSDASQKINRVPELLTAINPPNSNPRLIS
jgi:hypothetical protein